MKKLQNNFTTPEQSKRLLELGVPAWAADCYMLNRQIEHGWDYNDYDIYVDECNVKCATYKENNTILPCWSVGRLIEILTICNNFGTLTIDWFSFCKEQSPLQLVYDEICAGATQSLLDFSKLEE